MRVAHCAFDLDQVCLTMRGNNALMRELICTGIVAAVLIVGPASCPSRSWPIPETQAAEALPGTSIPLLNIGALARSEGAAVVNVSASSRSRSGGDEYDTPPRSQDDDLEDLLRGLPPRSLSPKPMQGSGFIVSPEGYVLTNNHLVEKADEITVRLTDKRKFKARLIGSDPLVDIALLKIEGVNLPTVRIGDVTALQVGEWVIAIGAPFGFDNTVTQGIVSAKGRMLPDESYIPFIQTDVAINPGNSGGPLFNLKGEVVGVNSQIYTRSGGYMGVSFAIPIDIAMQIKDELLLRGKVTRGRLGISHQSVDDVMAQAFKLPEARGALVTEVEKSAPADKAGLMPGDIILSFDSKPVESSSDLPRMVAGAKPTTRVRLEVWRKGKLETLTAVIGESPGRSTVKTVAEQSARLDKYGLALREISSSEKRELGFEHGVAVIRAGGEAARAGVLEGDVILGVNDNSVTTVKQCRELIANAGQIAALLVGRGNRVIYLPIRVKG